MSEIRPFRALRPLKEMAERVSAPLLDSSSNATSLKLMQDNPDSYLHVVKPHLHFSGEKKNPQKHYPLGLEYLQRFLKEGLLKQEQEPAYYVYQCIHGSHAYTGIIAAASVDEYDAGHIMKHENTLKEKQHAMLQHIDFFKCIGSPVLLTFPDSPVIEELLEVIMQHIPEYSFLSGESLKHNLWVVHNEDMIKIITEDFERIEKLYIADGHHRSAGASAYCAQQRSLNPGFTGSEAFNFFPVCMVPFSKLNIFEYHRLVKDARVYEADFIEKISEYFEVKPCGHLPFQPLRKMQFGIYFNSHAYQLKLKPEYAQSLGGILDNLDVSVVEEFLLKRVFGINDSKTDPRLAFIDGAQGILHLKERVDHKEADIAISLYPTSVEEVIRVAENHLIMPPKSTWVEPKIRSGLVIYNEES